MDELIESLEELKNHTGYKAIIDHLTEEARRTAKELVEHDLNEKKTASLRGLHIGLKLAVQTRERLIEERRAELDKKEEGMLRARMRASRRR